MGKKKYDLVDLFKFIGSILIFLMHLRLFGDSASFQFYWELLARWAVPFFFIVSSYFLFSKEDPQNHTIRKESLIKYLERIAVLYTAWFITNIPSIIYLRLIRPGIGKVETWLSFIKGALLSSTFTGSWYLLSSFFSAFILYLISKRFNTKQCILISVTPHLLCILSSAYGGLLPSSITIILKWLLFPLNIFGGLFYFSIGKYLYEKKDYMLNPQPSILCSFAMISLVLFIIEITTTIKLGIYSSSDYSFAVLPLALFIAIICFQSQKHITHSLLFRKMSTIIYCAQGNVLCAVSILGNCLDINSFFIKGLIGVILMSFIVIALLYAEKRKELKSVKYLL